VSLRLWTAAIGFFYTVPMQSIFLNISSCNLMFCWLGMQMRIMDRKKFCISISLGRECSVSVVSAVLSFEHSWPFMARTSLILYMIIIKHLLSQDNQNFLFCAINLLWHLVCFYWMKSMSQRHKHSHPYLVYISVWMVSLLFV